MKRPSKDDVVAHAAWVCEIASRLSNAWTRHPRLVVFAMRWFIHSGQHKAVEILEAIHTDVPGFVVLVGAGGGSRWYSPMAAMKPLFARLTRAWRGAYGCSCKGSCECGRMPAKPPISAAVQWIRDNPERA